MSFAWAYGYDLYAVLGVDAKALPADDAGRGIALWSAYCRVSHAYDLYAFDRGGNEDDYKLLHAAYTILRDKCEFEKWFDYSWDRCLS